MLTARLGIVEGEEMAEAAGGKQAAVESVPGQMSLFEQFEPRRQRLRFRGPRGAGADGCRRTGGGAAGLENARTGLAEVERLLADAEFAAAQARKAADEDRSEAQQARARSELAGERLAAAVGALEAARSVLGDEDVETRRGRGDG